MEVYCAVGRLFLNQLHEQCLCLIILFIFRKGPRLIEGLSLEPRAKDHAKYRCGQQREFKASLNHCYHV